jgi:membrane protease YdiL (CAAX protease family)
MKPTKSGRIPRWLTAVFMFAISFALLALSLFFDILSALYYSITIALAVMLWLHVDQQPPDELGFKFVSRWWLQLILGVLAGGIVIGLIIWLEVVLGWVVLTPLFSTLPWLMISGSLGFYTIWQGLVAGAEELVGRGYIQQNLATRLSIPFAILIAAVMFAVLHVPSIISNEVPLLNAGIMCLNLALGGILLGLAFAETRTLWLPIGIHFGWNFVMYHIAGFGGIGLYHVQNLGPEIITGGSIGPEAGFVGVFALLFLIALVWIWTRKYNKQLMRTFTRKPLLLFLFGFLVAAIPAVVGIIFSGLGLLLIVWLVYIIVFLQVWENKILCSHCPYYAVNGQTLRCHANYGLYKLWKYNPAPMSRAEQIQMVVGVSILIGFPFPLLVFGQQWLFLILTSVGILVMATILFGWLCLRCINFSCPFNRVPKNTVDDFLTENPEMRKAWEESGYNLGSLEKPD